MSKLLFNKLYIFSSPDKAARVIEFAAGKTIITSNSIDGTNRGKSVIMKSLYHTMGADCNFDDKWDDNSKIYILNFTVDGNGFYIFRHSSLFKIFDADKNLIFKTVSRHELSERLNDIFHFAVKLPARQNSSNDLSEEDEEVQRLEITPPAYNYLLYFVDQDGQEKGFAEAKKQPKQKALQTQPKEKRPCGAGANERIHLPTDDHCRHHCRRRHRETGV